jgi:hypothetical protein
VSLTLDPQPAILTAPGNQLTATFTLSGPSPTDLTVFMGAFVDASLTEPVSQQALSLPSSLIVPQGETGGGFQIIRGNDPLTPGYYTIAAEVAGTSVPQMATLQVLA